MLIQSMHQAERREREERASKCVISWSVGFRRRSPQPGPGVYEQVEYTGGSVQR